MKKKREHPDARKLDGLILTRDLSGREQRKANDELTEARRQVQAGLTGQDRLAARILQFKLKLHEYLSEKNFDPAMTFSSCLAQYVAILDKKRRTFADEINIDETELSQVINRHRAPAEYLFIRLEIHSNNNIPANWWFKLMEREKEHRISTNKELRKLQRRHVRKKLRITV